MARALPEDGLIVTIEVNSDYAAVARENFKRAGLDHKIHLLEGRAADVLNDLNDPFDLIFIDADKPSNPTYLTHAMRLSRPGTIIIGDNVVRGGTVVDGDSPDANVKGVRKFLEMISDDPRLTATAIQTVGEKGWDGFVMAVMTES
jgi:predicted O-methyltransferase YrrM